MFDLPGRLLGREMGDSLVLVELTAQGEEMLRIVGCRRKEGHLSTGSQVDHKTVVLKREKRRWLVFGGLFFSNLGQWLNSIQLKEA